MLGAGLGLRVLLQGPNRSLFFEKQGQGKIGVAESGSVLRQGSFLGCYGESMSCCALL